MQRQTNKNTFKDQYEDCFVYGESRFTGIFLHFPSNVVNPLWLTFLLMD